MTTRRWWILVGAAAVAAAIAVPLALTGGEPGKSHTDYALLWRQTHDGESLNEVLTRWPKDPYQHYTDGTKDDCYEWQDEPSGVYKDVPSHLYNLCFRNGVLRLKTVF